MKAFNIAAFIEKHSAEIFAAQRDLVSNVDMGAQRIIAIHGWFHRKHK